MSFVAARFRSVGVASGACCLWAAPAVSLLDRFFIPYGLVRTLGRVVCPKRDQALCRERNSNAGLRARLIRHAAHREACRRGAPPLREEVAQRRGRKAPEACPGAARPMLGPAAPAACRPRDGPRPGGCAAAPAWRGGELQGLI